MRKSLKLSIYLISFAFAIAALVSCNDDDEVLLANVTVQVAYPAEYAGLSLDNLTVELVNPLDGSSELLITNPSGVVSFVDIAPGNYTIQCSVTLNADVVQSITGYYQEITLNAIAPNIALTAGGDIVETITFEGGPSGDLLIKELYFSGANDPTWGVLFKDQFIEIYNNSAESIYADGLYIAYLAPTITGSSSSDPISTLSFDEFVYAEKMIQVPGSGQEHEILPGQSIVIAINAVDWTDGGAKADITVDLSTADFETYAIDWLEANNRSGNQWFDLDNVDVPNMNCVYMADYANYFNFNPSGTSIAIFKNDNFVVETILDPEASSSNPQHFVKIAVADVIDAVDGLNNENSAAYKRLPASLDAGFQYCGNSYSSKSIRRKIAKETNGRKVLKDTNNSTEDFEVTTLATPRGFGE